MFNPAVFTNTSDIVSVSSKELLDIQANIKGGFTLKHVRDIKRTYSQVHRTDKYPNAAQPFGQFRQMVKFLFTN